MNGKKFVVASIAVFVTFEILDAIVHGKILAPTYESLASVWRPDMMSKMGLMHIGTVIFSFLFTYVFIKGYENKGIAEGVRYGLLIGIFFNLPYALNSYVIYPLPSSLCVKWFVFGMIEFVIAGIVAAGLYKPRTAY